MTSQFDQEKYWKIACNIYPLYPTVRHRKRFILKALKNYRFNSDTFIFDYGCGEGNMLFTIKNLYKLTDEQIGGCDISQKVIDLTKEKINSKYIFNECFPILNKKVNIIICSEVIEHIKDYQQRLQWIYANLEKNGLLILSTQTGKIHDSDKYSGHLQHFDLKKLKQELEEYGFEIVSSRQWGFPFFTAQKYLTDYFFPIICKNFMEGEYTFFKKIIYETAYLLYYIHNLINFGPQIYIAAVKK
jgi:ubiquinone/menaquinone biosynthesis C-methylase UbiE